MLCSSIMIIFGLIALAKGEFKITAGRKVSGTSSRILGVLLLVGAGAGFLFGESGELAQTIAFVIVVIIGLISSQKIEKDKIVTHTVKSQPENIPGQSILQTVPEIENSKGDPRVGPLIRDFYNNSVSKHNQAPLKEFFATVPSGCEIVATFWGASAANNQKISQAISSNLDKMPIHGSAVFITSGYPDGFSIVLKGYLSGDLFTKIVLMLNASAKDYREFLPANIKPPEAQIAFNRPSAEKLQELP